MTAPLANPNQINDSVQPVQRIPADNSDAISGNVARCVTGVTRDERDMVTAAAMWLGEQAIAPQPTIPILRERFDLSTKQACDACALAATMRTNRRAFG
jgi:hypothetical protein